MSTEHAPKTPEHAKSHENSHEREKLAEARKAAEQAENKAKDSIEEIRSSIEKEAETSKKTQERQEDHAKQDKGPGQIRLDKNLKSKAYKKELHRIQSQLPKSQRGFSKLVHNSTVETVSEVGGKTVARPSGLLGGGIAAFIGTLALVIISRHYGFTYNFFVFIALLIAGFLVGLVAELIIRGLRKNA